MKNLRATRANRTSTRPDNFPGYVPRELASANPHYNATIRPSTRTPAARTAAANPRDLSWPSADSASTRCPSAASLRRPASPSKYLTRSDSAASARQLQTRGEEVPRPHSGNTTGLYSTRLHRSTSALSLAHPTSPAVEEIVRSSSALSRTNLGRRGLPLVAGEIRPGTAFSNTPETSPACELPTRLQSPFSSPRRRGNGATSPRTPVDFQEPILEEDTDLSVALATTRSCRRTSSRQRRGRPSPLVIPSPPRRVMVPSTRSPTMTRALRLTIPESAMTGSDVMVAPLSPLARNPQTPLCDTPSSLMAQMQSVMYESPKFHPRSLGWDLKTPALGGGFGEQLLAMTGLDDDQSACGEVARVESPGPGWF